MAVLRICFLLLVLRCVCFWLGVAWWFCGCGVDGSSGVLGDFWLCLWDGWLIYLRPVACWVVYCLGGMSVWFVLYCWSVVVDD